MSRIHLTGFVLRCAFSTVSILRNRYIRELCVAYASLVYPSHCYTNQNGCSCNAQSVYTDPWLTLWRIYTTTRTEEQPHAYNDTCMIDGRCGSSHRRHRFAITLHASYGLVLLKPSTIVDNQHNMLAHGVRATQTTFILRTRATEGHFANPLPFKATVSETKVQDPPSHRAKASEIQHLLLPPYSSLLSSPVDYAPPAL